MYVLCTSIYSSELFLFRKIFTNLIFVYMVVIRIWVKFENVYFSGENFTDRHIIASRQLTGALFRDNFAVRLRK